MMSMARERSPREMLSSVNIEVGGDEEDQLLSRLVMDSQPDIMDSIISDLSVFSFLRSKKPRRTKNKMNKMKQ